MGRSCCHACCSDASLRKAPPPHLLHTDTDINSCLSHLVSLLLPADTNVATFRHRTSCPVIFDLQSSSFPRNFQAPVQTDASEDFPLLPKTKATCDAVQSGRSAATKCTLMKTTHCTLSAFQDSDGQQQQPVSRSSLWEADSSLTRQDRQPNSSIPSLLLINWRA